jgi:hypothetical protein
MIQAQRDDALGSGSASGGEIMELHQLRGGDIFEFLDPEAAVPQSPHATATRLRSNRLRITIRPWGPKTRAVGPIGPWMFACKDEHGIEHHYALPPRMEVRVLERAVVR